MGNAQRAQCGRGAGTLRPHPEYTATDARHGQPIATSRCYQTGTHPSAPSSLSTRVRPQLSLPDQADTASAKDAGNNRHDGGRSRQVGDRSGTSGLGVTWPREGREPACPGRTGRRVGRSRQLRRPPGRPGSARRSARRSAECHVRPSTGRSSSSQSSAKKAGSISKRPSTPGAATSKWRGSGT